ncbi:hypothetical protein [Schlesneria paludicola]|nr:hypothetical protein [Schlesneria paludicola]
MHYGFQLNRENTPVPLSSGGDRLPIVVQSDSAKSGDFAGDGIRMSLS